MCKIDKPEDEFRPSQNYKKGFTSTCRACDNVKNKTRRRKKKLDQIQTIEQYLAIKIINMKRMDSKYRREVFEHPSVEYLKSLIDEAENRCVYTGVELQWHPSVDIYHKGSFDRIDNRYGHEVGNLQIVSVSANLLRGSRTHEEFLKSLKVSSLECVSDDEDITVN